MHKKPLQIETNFLEEDDPHVPIEATSKINFQQKQQAANLLQKILSLILAKNFIECWKELKGELANGRILDMRGNSNSEYNKNILKSQRVHYFENRIDDSSKINSYSYKKIVKSSVASESLLTNSRNPSRSKSMRVINQQIQNSRAKVLQQIVQKLQNARNFKIVGNEKQSNNQQVIKKLSHLQRVVRTLKTQNKREDQLSRNQKRKGSQSSSSYSQSQGIENNTRKQQRQRNEDEMVRSFMGQIQKIRSEINSIKVSNQILLRRQTSRSRLSQQQQKVFLQNTEMQTMKQTISQGVQTKKRGYGRDPTFSDNDSNYYNGQSEPRRKSDKKEQNEQKIKVGFRKGSRQVEAAPIPINEVSNTNFPMLNDLPKNNDEEVINNSGAMNKFPKNNITQINGLSNNGILERNEGFNEQGPIRNYDSEVSNSISEINKILQNINQGGSQIPLINNQQPVNYPAVHNNNSQRSPGIGQPIYQRQEQPAIIYQSSNSPIQFQPPQQFQPQFPQQVPLQQVPMQQVPLQQVPMQQVPMQQIPMQQVPLQQVPMQQVPLQQVPMQQVPIQRVPQYSPPVQPAIQSQIYTGPPSQPQRVPSVSNIVIRQGEYPRFDQIKTHTTFYSKNNVNSEIGSSSSLGTAFHSYQHQHHRNPSIHINQGVLNGNVGHSNYCSACGRSCGCPRNPHEINRF